MNGLSKIVFPTYKDTWENTRLIMDNIKEEVRQLKQTFGKNILMLAWSDLALTFMDLGLIDEFHILIDPVILGEDKTLFSIFIR